MYKYYKEWYDKWIRIFRWLCDKCKNTQKVKNLILKVKKHFWIIEWRMLCYKWYGENAINSDLYPKKFN
jgi:hypothetical protein